MSDKRVINATDLKNVNEGFRALAKQLPRAFSLDEFVTIIRKAAELATQVGGIEALAECAAELKVLKE